MPRDGRNEGPVSREQLARLAFPAVFGEPMEADWTDAGRARCADLALGVKERLRVLGAWPPDPDAQRVITDALIDAFAAGVSTGAEHVASLLNERGVPLRVEVSERSSGEAVL